MEPQQHINSQANFNKIYSLSFINEYFGLVFFQILSIILWFSLTILPQFKTNRSLIVEFVPFWPIILQNYLDLYDLDIFLLLPLTLQNTGCNSFILHLGLWKNVSGQNAILVSIAPLRGIWFCSSPPVAVTWYYFLSSKLEEIALTYTKELFMLLEVGLMCKESILCLIARSK